MFVCIIDFLWVKVLTYCFVDYVGFVSIIAFRLELENISVTNLDMRVLATA